MKGYTKNFNVPKSVPLERAVKGNRPTVDGRDHKVGLIVPQVRLSEDSPEGLAKAVKWLFDLAGHVQGGGKVNIGTSEGGTRSDITPREFMEGQVVFPRMNGIFPQNVSELVDLINEGMYNRAAVKAQTFLTRFTRAPKRRKVIGIDEAVLKHLA